MGVGSNPTSDNNLFLAFASSDSLMLNIISQLNPVEDSRVAQWKRAGPITQRSVDRNHALLKFYRSIYTNKRQDKKNSLIRFKLKQNTNVASLIKTNKQRITNANLTKISFIGYLYVRTVFESQNVKPMLKKIMPTARGVPKRSPI